MLLQKNFVKMIITFHPIFLTLLKAYLEVGKIRYLVQMEVLRLIGTIATMVLVLQFPVDTKHPITYRVQAKITMLCMA